MVIDNIDTKDPGLRLSVLHNRSIINIGITHVSIEYIFKIYQTWVYFVYVLGRYSRYYLNNINIDVAWSFMKLSNEITNPYIEIYINYMCILTIVFMIIISPLLLLWTRQ